MSQSRRGSRCETPRLEPYVWIDYFDISNASYLDFERFISLQPETVAEEITGYYEALRIRASQGRLRRGSSELENIKLYPELFELKWTIYIEGINVQVRQYHGEPLQAPDFLVASHVHIKFISGTNDEIRDRQNQEIEFARKRYLTWDVPRL